MDGAGIDPVRQIHARIRRLEFRHRLMGSLCAGSPALLRSLQRASQSISFPSARIDPFLKQFRFFFKGGETDFTRDSIDAAQTCAAAHCPAAGRLLEDAAVGSADFCRNPFEIETLPTSNRPSID